MTAVQPWLVEMDAVVNDWCIATMSQQGCNASKEVAVVFWAGILGRELVGPFRVPEGVEMTFEKYTEFLTDHFLPWRKMKIIRMHDNAPSHAARNNSASLAAMGIKGEKLMVWPPSP